MRQLTDHDIETICGILDGWCGKLTWNALSDQAYLSLYHRYTRQCLERHPRIKAAYALCKQRGGKIVLHRGASCEEEIKSQREARLEAEVKRLKAENVRLLQQIFQWGYHAENRGIPLELLNQPVPRVDRGKTEDAGLLMVPGSREERGRGKGPDTPKTPEGRDTRGRSKKCRKK